MSTSRRRPGERAPHGWLGPGTVIGGYELLAPIAKGGMARVWAARPIENKKLGPLVAIKTILPHLAEDPEFERMFLDEARIASRIHHPNVCAPSELGEERGTLYLSMEWVNGGSLASILGPSRTGTGIDYRIAARIVADAAAGLHAAHELFDDNGEPLCVVHRDVSPQNLLISSTTGDVKVADFGVAKALGQTHSETVAGELKGKIAYMAPEQITGEDIDRRTDVFALGMVLFEATIGSRPFTGANDAQIMLSVMTGEPARPSKVIQGFPPELEAIILRALQKDPAERYPTAARMRRDLENWLRTTGPSITHKEIRDLVRARLGPEVDRRNEAIRIAAEQNLVPGHVVNRSAQESRSGVRGPELAEPAEDEATIVDLHRFLSPGSHD